MSPEFFAARLVRPQGGSTLRLGFFFSVLFHFYFILFHTSVLYFSASQGVINPLESVPLGQNGAERVEPKSETVGLQGDQTSAPCIGGLFVNAPPLPSCESLFTLVLVGCATPIAHHGRVVHGGGVVVVCRGARTGLRGSCVQL